MVSHAHTLGGKKDGSRLPSGRGSPEFCGVFGVLPARLCRTFQIVISLLKKCSAEPQRFCRTLGAKPNSSGAANSSPKSGRFARAVSGESFRKESENSRRLWLFPGSVRGFPRKTPGKSRENCWKISPESRNATNSRISGTGKGKPAGKVGSTLPGTLSPPSGRGCFLKSTVSLLGFF